MADPDQSKHPALALYAELLGFSALIAAWLALLGWSYVETYFRLWGIPLSGTGVATNELVYYSAEVARRSWYYVILALVLLAVVGIAVHFGLRRVNIVAAALLASIGIAGLFSFGGWIGVKQAQSDLALMRAEAYAGLPRALILLEREPPQADRRARALRDDLSNRGCYRILYMGGDTLWVVRPRPLNQDGTPPAEAPAVLGLPRAGVVGVRLLGHRPNCP